MKVVINVSKSFVKKAKPLLKKFKSLQKDLVELENILYKNPTYGKSLGQNIFKIRLAVSSKSKGKSGGLRVLSFVEKEVIAHIENKNEEFTVTLLSIYDKSETESITESEIKNLINWKDKYL